MLHKLYQNLWTQYNPEICVLSATFKNTCTNALKNVYDMRSFKNSYTRFSIIYQKLHQKRAKTHFYPIFSIFVCNKK